MMLQPTPSPRFPRLLLTSALALLGLLGCTGGGNRSSGDHAGQLNGKFMVTPTVATVISGQTQSFLGTSPWGTGATWSVLPATGGSFDANGTFTASSTLGRYQIVAMWNGDVRYTATATVTIVAPPPPALLNPNLVQAFGAQPGVAGTGITNGAVVGESIPATQAATVNGAVRVRHGFDPPVK